MTAQTAAEQMWAWITGKSRGAHLGYPRAWEEWFDAEGKFRADPPPRSSRLTVQDVRSKVARMLAHLDGNEARFHALGQTARANEAGSIASSYRRLLAWIGSEARCLTTGPGVTGEAMNAPSSTLKPEPIAEGVAADLFCDYCQLTRRWGLMVSGLADYDLTEVLLACPLLSAEDHAQGISDGFHFFFYSTEAEMWAAYGLVVGDDGPTEGNAYSGPAKVYAVTCSSSGRLLGENT